ncbi:response regulator [Antribacter gilvus]|uniref:response regulator n=1 Tax=Antribacter gilvus TaxID=2304675 RepID=UPI001F0C6D38|nr:response regulator transcription factor [Antribacter gilvus]
MSVLVADDEPVVRQSVATILGTDPGVRVVAEAASGAEAVREARAHAPDVVLLDLRMSGPASRDGLDAAASILGSRPGPAVVMLTTFGEDDLVDHALGLGVSGFLLKSGDPYELVAGVRAAASGGACLSPTVAARLIRARARSKPARGPAAPAPRLPGLTARERQVLTALARGLSNAEIASEQHLTEGTVKGYVSALFLRLGVRNRVEAAVLAHRAGLADQA